MRGPNVVLLVLLVWADAVFALHRLSAAGTHTATARATTATRTASSPFGLSYPHWLRGGARATKSKPRKKVKESSREAPRSAGVASMPSLESLVGLGPLIGSFVPSVNMDTLKNSNSYVRLVIESWEKSPPITRLYISSSFLLTLVFSLFNGNQWPQVLDIDWIRIFTRLEIWRVVSGFLFLGSFGLNYLLTLHFMWTYMGDLEKLSAAKPENFIVMMGFGAAALMVSYLLLGISPKFLGHNIATYLVYSWSRANEGMGINMMDLFVIQAELIPWFFCLQSLIIDGEFPTADVIGIAVGHLYHYYLARGDLTPPRILKEIIPASFRKQYNDIVLQASNRFENREEF